MRRVTITIDFYTDATPLEIDGLAMHAQVQIAEPADADGNDAEFTTSEVRTTVVTTAV